MEEKAKKAKEKYSAKEKQWEAQVKMLQDKVTSLEKKFNKHEDFYAIELVELKKALDAKVKYVENLKGKAAEQYTEGFDEAFKQVKFLYAHLDVSSYRYFKEIRDRQLVDKPLPGFNATEAEGRDQTKIHTIVGEDLADDYPVAP